MGRVMYDMARESIGYQTEYDIKGYIDDNIHSLDAFSGYPPILGTISEYQPQENDIFICSIGGGSRRACMESIINRGGEFLTMIHNTARIGSNVQIGKGCMVGAFTTIAADAKIGDYNFIQSNMPEAEVSCLRENSLSGNSRNIFMIKAARIFLWSADEVCFAPRLLSLFLCLICLEYLMQVHA